MMWSRRRGVVAAAAVVVGLSLGGVPVAALAQTSDVVAEQQQSQSTAEATDAIATVSDVSAKNVSGGGSSNSSLGAKDAQVTSNAHDAETVGA